MTSPFLAPPAGTPLRAKVLAQLFETLALEDTWVPSTTNVTLGTGGEIRTRMRQSGQEMQIYMEVVLGTGGQFGGIPTFSLPVPVASWLETGTGALLPGVEAWWVDRGTTQRHGMVSLLNATTIEILWMNAGVPAAVTSSSPWSWAAGDLLIAMGRYPIN